MASRTGGAMTDFQWTEIDELPNELEAEIFFVDGKFKAPLMAGNILIHR